MPNRRLHRGFLPAGALGLALIVLAACGAPPERSILTEFFAAARLRDNTVLQKLSTVTFEPLDRGIIVDFEIVSVVTPRPNHKEVTITAPIKRPDGQVVGKTLIVALDRGVLDSDPESARRWIVTAVTEVGGPRTR